MFGPTDPENAAIIQSIAGRLSELSIGATIMYPELARLAKRDIKVKHRHLLQTAVEHAERESGCIFASIRGIGIKRLPSSEMPEHGLSVLRRIRRAANRGKKRIDRINTNSLAPDEQRRVIGYSAMLGAVSMISDGRRANAIASVVTDVTKPIPPSNILDMFR